MALPGEGLAGGGTPSFHLFPSDLSGGDMQLCLKYSQRWVVSDFLGRSFSKLVTVSLLSFSKAPACVFLLRHPHSTEPKEGIWLSLMFTGISFLVVTYPSVAHGVL